MRTLILIFIFMPLLTSAQKEKGQFTFSILGGTNNYHIGVANPSAGIEIVEGDTMVWTYSEAEYSASPTAGIALDCGIHRHFSMGLALGYNTIKIAENNIRVHYPGTSVDQFTDFGNIDFKAIRYTLSIRPLFHYVKSPKFDLYSGLRLNYIFFKKSLDSNINGLTPERIFPEFDEPSYIPALIPFGIRYYFTKYIGIGMELHAGPPSWGNVQFNARF